jgi:hypothetical protein
VNVEIVNHSHQNIDDADISISSKGGVSVGGECICTGQIGEFELNAVPFEELIPTEGTPND